MNVDDMINLLKMNKCATSSVCVNLEEVEWIYSMRRDMQEIVPGLFLGPYSAAVKAKAEHLDKVGITHIICVRQDIEAHFIRPNFPDKYRYLVLNIADTCTTNIIQFLPQVKKFVDEALKNGGKVLVHGNLGVSRSASLVIGYIMESRYLSFEKARCLVQEKRFCVSPNEGFLEQLKEYEPIYKANKTLQNGQTSQETGKLKRKFEESEEPDKTFMDCAN